MENTAENLQYRLSQGNMHIHLSGVFNESLAHTCIDCISQSYQAGGRIFLDTRGLAGFCDKAIGSFKEFFTETNSLARKLYLKGEQGFKILPEGGKVIVMNIQNDKKSSCACGGKCGGANAKADETGHSKCKVCKCKLARERAAQKAGNE